MALANAAQGHMTTPVTPSDPVISSADRAAIMLSLMCVMMLAALETTIIAPAMPSIGRDLGGVEHMSWIVTAYLVISTALTPLYGKIADIKGRRIVLIFAAVSYLVGSLACALADSMMTLILARCLQGVGGGGIFAMTQTIIGDIVPLRDRPKYQVYTSTVWLLANMMGPVLGGLLTDYVHWSMIFWINLPLGIPALLVLWPRLSKLPRNERPHSLDLLGAFLIVVATVLIMLALSWGGVRYAWASWEMLALGGATLLAWVLLAVRQLTAHEPLIPLTVLGNAGVQRAVFTSFSAMAAYIAIVIWLPVWLQTVEKMSVTAAGLWTLPLMAASTIGAQWGARAMRGSGNFHYVPIAGMVLATLGSIVMGIYAAGMPMWLFALTTAVISAGTGAIFPMLSVGLQSAVPPHELGTTMALNVFMRSLGSAIGVAIMGAILIGIAGAAALEQHGAAAGATPELILAYQIGYGAVALGFFLALLSLLRLGRPSMGRPESRAFRK
jgi:EmrB/QacA subfamily drug resistance transporter